MSARWVVIDDGTGNEIPDGASYWKVEVIDNDKGIWHVKHFALLSDALRLLSITTDIRKIVIYRLLKENRSD